MIYISDTGQDDYRTDTYYVRKRKIVQRIGRRCIITQSSAMVIDDALPNERIRLRRARHAIDTTHSTERILFNRAIVRDHKTSRVTEERLSKIFKNENSWLIMQWARVA